VEALVDLIRFADERPSLVSPIAGTGHCPQTAPPLSRGLEQGPQGRRATGQGIRPVSRGNVVISTTLWS
jgi:hypothetical protein